MEGNRKTDQEIQELDFENMEQVSGGDDTQNGYFYCSFCQRQTKWENGKCTEAHRRPGQSLFVPGQKS